MYEFVQLTLMTIILQFVCCSKNCAWYKTAVKIDMYMEGQVLRQLRVPSLYDCAARCVMSPACKAFNYDLETSTCQLNRNKSDRVDLTSKSGFVFSDIHHWPKNMTGSCSTMTRSVGEECSVDRLGKAVCKQEFVGCKEPPAVKDSEVSNEGHFLHAEAVYTCADNFRSCGQGANWRLRCEQSGTWEGVSFVCERFKWINPSVLFNESFPCGPVDNIIVTVAGVPLNGKRFTTWILARSSVLFCFDVRYMFSSRAEYLVINTRKNGNWGKEVTLPTYPFELNREFLMEVSLLNGEYKVKVDGNLVATFSERYAGEKPEKLQISGDVNLRKVELDDKKHVHSG